MTGPSPPSVFAPALADVLCQGDVFVGLSVAEVPAEAPITRRLPFALILSHDCEVDKQQETLLVARVRSIDELSASDARSLRVGNVRNAMHLPPVGVVPEGFVDFRFSYRIERVQIDAAMLAGRRLASMTPEGQAALQAYIYRFFARRLPA